METKQSNTKTFTLSEGRFYGEGAGKEVEGKSSNLIYEESGVSQKRTSSLIAWYILDIIIGIAVIFFSQWKVSTLRSGTSSSEFVNGVLVTTYNTGKEYLFNEDTRIIFILIGAFIIIGGIAFLLLFAAKPVGKNTYIKVYEDHIQGVMNSGTAEVNLRYPQITECVLTSTKTTNILRIKSYSSLFMIYIDDTNNCREIYNYINSKLGI